MQLLQASIFPSLKCDDGSRKQQLADNCLFVNVSLVWNPLPSRIAHTFIFQTAILPSLLVTMQVLNFLPEFLSYQSMAGWCRGTKSQHPCLFDGIHHRSGWATFQSYLHLCLASSWPYPASLISLQVSSEITTSINQFYKNPHIRLFLGNLNWNTFHQFFSLINFSRSFGPLSLISKLVKHTFSLSRHQW